MTRAPSGLKSPSGSTDSLPKSQPTSTSTGFDPASSPCGAERGTLVPRPRDQQELTRQSISDYIDGAKNRLARLEDPADLRRLAEDIDQFCRLVHAATQDREEIN